MHNELSVQQNTLATLICCL